VKPAPPNLLLILADTARADAFQPWFASAATPNVGRLAREGVTYATAIAQAPWTVPSTASIFSGVLPTVHGIAGDSLRWIDGRRTSPSEKVANYKGDWLPESMRERGYRTWAVSSNAWISRWGGFARGFDDFHDIRPWRTASTPVRRLLRRVEQMQAIGRKDKGGKEAVERFRRFVGGRQEPWFAFVNLMEMHSPYDPPRGFHPALASGWRSAMLGDPLALLAHQLLQTRLRAHASPSYIRSIRSLYEACGRYVDSLVSAFVEAVPDGAPLVVVLMSDHGESLGEHGLFGHHSSLHEPLLRVPLVVWNRGLSIKPGLIEEPVSLLGLANSLVRLSEGEWSFLEIGDPVVAEYESTMLHTVPPPELRWKDGDPTDGLPPLSLHRGAAIRIGNWKFVALEGGDDALYDLASDPSEERNLVETRPDVVDMFAPHIRAWHERLKHDSMGETMLGPTAEDEIADHLRALGYID
jgi:arylsulfatase A-like enzyme